MGLLAVKLNAPVHAEAKGCNGLRRVPEHNNVMEHELRTFNTMPTLMKQTLERYLRGRFGPQATLLTYGAIGKESSQGSYKQ